MVSSRQVSSGLCAKWEGQGERMAGGGPAVTRKAQVIDLSLPLTGCNLRRFVNDRGQDRTRGAFQIGGVQALDTCKQWPLTLFVSDASILIGGGICPVGTPDLSHDRAMRVRPVGTVELLSRRIRGGASFNHPYGTTGAGASPVSSQGVPTGRVHFKLAAEPATWRLQASAGVTATIA